jgi:glycogen debranching enzyme
MNEYTLLHGEVIINEERVLEDDDLIFDPRERPDLDTAISMIIGRQGGYNVPFASVNIPRHKSLPGQNLFECLFGRDSLLVADLLKFKRPELQLEVVKALASVQGEKFDRLSEEEPGRMAHEVREANDPVAIKISADANWKFPYYGAVDTTLIWLKTLGNLAKEDPSILELDVAGSTLKARAVAALKWIIFRLQTPSGLIESNRSNPKGITNQVWKDSGDSYLHADGRIASITSTASIETVAETFDALQACIELAKLTPDLDWPLEADEINAICSSLQELLIEYMWVGDHFAIGTDRDPLGVQEPIDSQASNQGRLLDSEIFRDEKFKDYRDAIAAALSSPGLLGETGLRTLSADHPKYRAGGYHTGSAWPMDGVFAARGLAKFGYAAEAAEIAIRIKRSIEAIGGYPEYFRGDYPDGPLISHYIVDVKAPGLPNSLQSNRIIQPPQLIQGWTVGAYAWLVENYPDQSS